MIRYPTKQRLLIFIDYRENPDLPRVLIVSSAVYPRLVVNYDLGPLTQKQSLQYFRGSPEFPNQNLRQIGHGVCSDIQTK